jgi:hypothetical protein
MNLIVKVMPEGVTAKFPLYLSAWSVLSRISESPSMRVATTRKLYANSLGKRRDKNE